MLGDLAHVPGWQLTQQCLTPLSPLVALVLFAIVGKPRDGITPDPTQEVNDKHYSANKGLGYSHQVYVDMRGRVLRVRPPYFVEGFRDITSIAKYFQ